MIKRYTGHFTRFFNFLCVGGIAALANLLCFSLIYNVMSSSFGAQSAYFSGFFVATEISILVNFTLNDWITFRHLRTAQRSWQARCLRFHMTAITGVALVLCISFSLLHFTHMLALFAQAIALMVATCFNFAGHHFFTYHRTNRRKTDEVTDYYSHIQ